MIREKLYCRDCERFLGEALHDHQVLRLGENADIWVELRFTCKCGHPKVWKPKTLPAESQTDEEFAVERDIRLRLGRKQFGRPPRVADDKFEE